jgi:hypothetical protein
MVQQRREDGVLAHWMGEIIRTKGVDAVLHYQIRWWRIRMVVDDQKQVTFTSETNTNLCYVDDVFFPNAKGS